MSGWLHKHWRDVALLALLGIIALTWWDEMRGAYLEGAAARCRWLPW